MALTAKPTAAPLRLPLRALLVAALLLALLGCCCPSVPLMMSLQRAGLTQVEARPPAPAQRPDG